MANAWWKNLTWNAVNKTNAQSVQTFIEQNATNRTGRTQQAIVDRLNRERQGSGAKEDSQDKSLAVERAGIGRP